MSSAAANGNRRGGTGPAQSARHRPDGPRQVKSAGPPAGGREAQLRRWLVTPPARLYIIRALRPVGRSGGVPERSNGAVSKTVVRASVPWVRIPPPPPTPHLHSFIDKGSSSAFGGYNPQSFQRLWPMLAAGVRARKGTPLQLPQLSDCMSKPYVGRPVPHPRVVALLARAEIAHASSDGVPGDGVARR